MAAQAASGPASLTRETFVAQLQRGAQVMSARPVTSAMLRCLAEVLAVEEPSWWKKTQKAWEKRRFGAWNEAWGLFLAAVHFEALGDPDSPLAPYLPSTGGTDEADPSRGLLRFLLEAPASFYDRLRDGHRRSFIAARSTLWTLASAPAFASRKLPFYLVQVNAGAGLDLLGDYSMPKKIYDPDLVAARIGLDPEPLDPRVPEQRRWLTASILPDDPSGSAELDAAVERLTQAQQRDPNFVQLVPCAAEKAPAFIAKNIPAEPDAGLLVFNMGATVRMSDADYAAYQAEMLGMMAPWGDRAVWLEVETVRGELYSTTIEIRLFKAGQGPLQRCIAGRLDFAAGAANVDLDAVNAFLGFAPARPMKPSK